MLIPQKLLRNLFGYAAVISAGVFATMIPVLIEAPFPHATARFHPEPYGLLLIVMRELMFLLPPFVAIFNGMAWLTLRKNLPSARGWALAASVSFLLLSAPFLAATIVILQYHLTGAVAFCGVLVLFLSLNSLGIAGIAAFANRDAMLDVAPRTASMTHNAEAVRTFASAA